MPSFASPPARQLFSIPYNYVLYIIQNPASPEVLHKLYETCKYFFVTNPILLHSDLMHFIGGFYDELKEIKTIAKFWPTSQLAVSSKIVHEKFHRFSPTFLILNIKNSSFSLEDFEIIAAENTIKTFVLKGAIQNATVDVVLDKLPNIEKFCYDNAKEVFSLESIKKLNQVQRKPNIQFCAFYITKIAPDFSPLLFTGFMKAVTSSAAAFKYSFAASELSHLKVKFEDVTKNWKDPIFQYVHFFDDDFEIIVGKSAV